MKNIDKDSLHKAYQLFESNDIDKIEVDNREIISKGIEQSYYYEGYKKEE